MVTGTELLPSGGADLSSCDREPIHIPGSIQPHGLLLIAEEPGLRVLQISRNAREYFGRDAEEALGLRLDDLLGEDRARPIRERIAGETLEGNPSYLGAVELGRVGRERPCVVLAHRIDGLLYLEFEPSRSVASGTFQEPYSLVRTFLASLERVATVEELADLTAREVRRITEFDRVLVYRFDPEWNGRVIAESRNDRLPSYLGLHFPASDIPSQARELYTRNRLRLIADAEYRPVPLVPPLNPATGRPTDMTYAALRSVSPVHVQYMKNMGTAASMSISLLRDGRLWGLVSCHHKDPRAVPFEVRTACDLVGQVLSLQLAAKERNADSEHRMRLKSSVARLLAFMAHEEDFADGLVKNPDEFLGFVGAGGAAVVREGRCALLGGTPGEAEARRIADWLVEHGRSDVFHTDSLAAHIPWAEACRGSAAGLLAIAISQIHRSYVLWFRPEYIRTVEWGGDPARPTEPAEGGAGPNPRRSFETWKQTVRLRSRPWHPAEADAVAELRNAIVSIVLRKAEELAQLNAELQRTNRELEAFSYSVSHDLRAPFRHIVGYSELLLEEAGLSDQGRRFARTIIDSAQFAGILVDNLLAFSQMGRSAIHPEPIDMDRLVEEVRRDVMGEAQGRKVTWRVAKLPRTRADLMMLRLAVRNLLSNAVKYTKPRDEAVIEVGTEARPGEVVYFVRDNGVGFDMRYIDKLFGVFQRLHRMEDFEGTGIGLANVRRIVERHGGRAWAAGKVDEGATFYFSLPEPTSPEVSEVC